MANLQNLQISDTYDGLIKTSDENAIDGNLKTLQDGAGNDLPMQVSTSTVNFTGAVTGVDGLAPAGGTTGQVLTKDTNTDYDYSWTTPAGGGGGVTNYGYQAWQGANIGGYGANSYWTTSQPLNGDIFWQDAIDLNPDATIFGELNVWAGQQMNNVAIGVTACTAASSITLRIWNSFTTGNNYGMPYQVVHTETITVPVNASGDWITHTFASAFTPVNDTNYWFSLSSTDWTGSFNLRNCVGRNTVSGNYITVFDINSNPNQALAVNSLYYSGVVPSAFVGNESFGHRDEACILLFKKS